MYTKGGKVMTGARRPRLYNSNAERQKAFRERQRLKLAAMQKEILKLRQEISTCPAADYHGK